MTPTDLIATLAAELQDVIRNLDETHLKENPDDEFVDLAARLVLKLKRKAIAIEPVPSRRAELERVNNEAAARAFDILTTWLNHHPECTFMTERGQSGRFGIVVRTPGEQTHVFFQGDTIQDAYAQAATALQFVDEGLL